MQIESLGLADNLMIPGGIETGGGTLVTPADADAAGIDVVELAIYRLAQRLLRNAVVPAPDT